MNARPNYGDNHYRGGNCYYCGISTNCTYITEDEDGNALEIPRWVCDGCSEAFFDENDGSYKDDTL